MNRKMFKLVELTTRQMAASINRLNNTLPFFPTATEASKFSEIELIGLLECSLPATWRAKFDLDSYIPTLHSKDKLNEACEAIEQSEIAVERPSKVEQLSSTTIGYKATIKGSKDPIIWKSMRILLDSGCAVTLINQNLVKSLKTTKEHRTKWTTKAGNFSRC
jgi:hypothetical protein